MMTQGAKTPEGGHTMDGGWYAELDSADQLRHIWRTDEDGELEKVAVVIGDSDNDYDPVPAQRARLIAAAPDLLEALTLLEDAIDVAVGLLQQPEEHQQMLAVEIQRRKDVALAAIAKALGQ